MKTALVYDWLVTMGGGEKTLEAIVELYPAPIHTLVHDKTLFPDRKVISSFLQKIPFSTRCYRYLLPLFPLAVEQFDLSGYDLILSTSHAVAKGVLTHPNQLHLCYCFTPMRYAWDLTHLYLDTISGVQKILARAALHYLRNWDIASLNRVDHFAAISHYTAQRIKKNYGREATVIYPPVAVEQIPFQPIKETYYITVSRMVPYKKIDLIAEAFAHLPEQRLLIIGDGPDLQKVKARAGKNVEILGYKSDPVVREYIGKAKGFIFAAEEDFGIVAVEAQAAGTPLIAFGKGGALETVLPEKTGVFFPEQTVASLVQAIRDFEKKEFDPALIRGHSLKFGRDRFQREFKQFVDHKIEEYHESHHSRRG